MTPQEIVIEASKLYKNGETQLIEILCILSKKYDVELEILAEAIKQDKTFMQILEYNAKENNLTKERQIKTASLSDAF